MSGESPDGSKKGNHENEADTEKSDARTRMSKECWATGREQGLVGKYDIWLCRQAFREHARAMGFKKYR